MTDANALPGLPAVTTLRAFAHAGWSIHIVRVEGVLRADAWRCDDATAHRYVCRDVPLAEGTTPGQVRAWAEGLSCDAPAPWFAGLARIEGRAEVVAS